ncbi:MAG TPA: hypothetical protein VGJ48_20055 [Pyrinomonadaceae bacterium]|jgi:hypothetical protein
MANKLIFDGAVGVFNVNKPLTMFAGSFSSDVDADVTKHLTELNKLLGKRIFKKEPDLIKDELERPLTPKRLTKNQPWADDSLAMFCSQEDEKQTRQTLSEFIESEGELSKLKYDFDQTLAQKGTTVDSNVRTVLSYPAIKDYLVTYGYLAKNLKEITGLTNFVFTRDNGARNVVNYATVSAARTIINRKKLDVQGPNQDNSQMFKALKAKNIPLTATAFSKGVIAVLESFVFNAVELALIEEVRVKLDLGEIPDDIKTELIKYMRNSVIPIDKNNADDFIPAFIAQIQSGTLNADALDAEVPQTDQDFEVVYLDDDDAQLEVSRSAVLCASQLYFSMILGEEMKVFDCAKQLTHKYLVRKNIDLQDRKLRENLQNYVFFRKFTAPTTKKTLECVNEAERQMFYRQVFSAGNGRTTEDVIVNREFPRLWKVLMLESAKYLERGQASPNPENFVSRQNVKQAVEDLQYNLSIHCTGMATVITPLIYAELDFVTRRIFNHPVIRRHVAPSGGSWLKVVEEIYTDMMRVRPKASVIYSKAKLGHEILVDIANYNPATFEDPDVFSSFIRRVDAFITTQSILQEALKDDLMEGDEEGEELDEKLGLGSPNGNGYGHSAPPLGAMNAPAVGAAAGGDEWDF